MKKIICAFLLLFFFQFTFAKGNKMGNFLIVYGSFKNSTKEIAEKMKTILETKNYSVDIMPAANKKSDLSKYDLIILGSAIHGDAPHPTIIEFVNANEDQLNKKKTAVFIVCITITSIKAEKRENASHYPEKVSIGFTPINKVVFAGVAEDGGWFGNWMGKVILGIKPGDYRDWGKIENWTMSLINYIAK